MKHYYLFLLFTAFFLSSCRDADPVVLAKESLFSLNYGKTDDSLYFSLDRSYNLQNPASVRMVNGIFYIMNNDLKKVMKFTSYGDLISVIGSRETVSEPILVEENDADNTIINRKAVFFPFYNIGNIEVDQRQFLYVTDILPETRYEWDNTINSMLTDMVYIFDSNLNYIDNLGQDGIGGLPFPYIQDIKTNPQNEIIITSRTVDSYYIYWFNSEWKLLYTVELNNNTIPYPPASQNLIASIDSIKVSNTSRALFIKFDYYNNIESDTVGGTSDIDFYKSYIQVLDLEEESYIKAVEIPDVFTVSTDPHAFTDERRQVVYDFLDIAGNEAIYLSGIINNETLQLVILGTDGRILSNSRLGIDFSNYFHIDMNLSSEGILSALLAGNNNISVVWWRTDRLLREKL